MGRVFPESPVANRRYAGASFSVFAVKGSSNEITFLFSLLALAALPLHAQEQKADYVHAVARGGGLVPGQTAEVSDAERAFRAGMEARKDAMLAHADAVAHPAIYTPADIARAKENTAKSPAAQQWVQGQIDFANEIARPAGILGG